MTMQMVLICGAGATAGVALLQGWVIWKIRRTAASVRQLEARVSRHADAMTLLSETAETGFASVARELERVRPPRKTRAAATRRLTVAARKGQSVAEIAAAQEISESEVRLRLHLSKQRIGKGETADGSLRA